MTRINAEKRTRDKILTRPLGVGLLVYKSGLETITQVEVYVDGDGQLRRLSDAELLLPLQIERPIEKAVVETVGGAIGGAACQNLT